MGGWGELYPICLGFLEKKLTLQSPLKRERTGHESQLLDLCYMIHYKGGQARPGSKTNFVVAKLYVHFLRSENILIL